MIRIILFSLIGIVTGKFCPPPEVLLPCTCFDDIPERSWISCSQIQRSFNLKEIFDNASVYVNDDIIFDYLYIASTLLSEIGEGAVQDLKFKQVSIQHNYNLTYISPRAFNASRNITTYLNVWENRIENPAPHQRDIFDFINSFQNLNRLSFVNNSLSSIPENALQNLDSLEEAYLMGNRLSTVGSRAFSGAPNLKTLYLLYNSIGSETFRNDTFHNISGSVIVYLTCNEIDFLEQTRFQPLLDQAVSILVGGVRCSSGPESDSFHCDERANWICENKENYSSKLFGFNCKPGAGYMDIWGYCWGRNDTVSTILS